MHRTLSAVGVLLVFSTGTLAVAANQPPPPHHVAHAAGATDPCARMPSRWQRKQCYSYHLSAPGDEYFGRMKMSYLGIDNTAHDVAIEAGAYTTDPGLISKLAFADEALQQWEHRYPGDPQLARSYFLMVEALRKVYTMDAQQRAWSYMQHIIHVYPSSYFAKALRADIARGFTEYWFTVADICPAPLPTINPRHPQSTPSPTPELTPEETPTPTPPGQPKVVLMTPPCVPAETPQPEESAVPIPMESTAPMPSEEPSPEPT